MNSLLMGLVILTAVGSFALSQQSDTGTTRQFNSSQKLDITPLETSGKIDSITLSPNGKFAAYVTRSEGKQSIRLRKIASNREIEIVHPTENSFFGLSFSPDSNDLYYISFTATAREDAILYRIPANGGSSVKIAEKVDKDSRISGAAAVSPDGKTIAFERDSSNACFIKLANADGTGERTLVKYANSPGVTNNNLAWSPDGKTIAYALGKKEKEGQLSKLVGINVSDGSPRVLNEAEWALLNDIVWLSNGNLIVSGMLRSDKNSETVQIWLIAPNAPPQRLTDDPGGYQRLTSTAKGDKLLALQLAAPHDLWISPNDNVSAAKQITASGDIYGRIRWVPGGKLVFSAFTTNVNRDIVIINADGSGRKQLTDQGVNLLSSVSVDGRYIFFIRTIKRDNAEISNVWRMNVDGSDQKQLTNGTNDRSPRPSPDGKWLYYTEVTAGEWNICKIPVGGGEPVKIASKKMSSALEMSPRTGMIAYINDEEWLKGGLAKIVIISAEDQPVKTLLLPRTAQLAHFEWTADESAITFQDSRNGGSNIWAIQLSGEGESKPVTNFAADKTLDYDFSPDGKHILLLRSTSSAKAVFIRMSKKGS